MYKNGLVFIMALASVSLTGCGGGGSSTGSSLVPTATATAAPVSTQTLISQVGSVADATGGVSNSFAGGFTLFVDSAHGYVHVYTTSSTVFVGAKPYSGEQVEVVGNGTTASSITATKVTQLGVTKSTPAPLATATPVPATSAYTAPAATAFMSSSWGKVSAFQIFDETYAGTIYSAQAQTDGPKYVHVWGTRVGMAGSWRAKNPSMQAAYYIPQETDANSQAWGYQGHTLSWWQSNHPDWILYACDANNNPTHTPAIIPGLPTNVPLDIHNPAVVDYQIRQVAAPFAYKNGYNALAIDEVAFWNSTLNGAGSGYYGCGIWQNGTFVRRYNNPNSDANWTADTVAWVKAAHNILKNDPVVSAYHLKLIINHPAGNISDVNQQTILTNTDAVLNETGYSSYGNYSHSNGLLKTTIDWTRWAQQHGTAVLTNDTWTSETALTASQREYTVASYLLSNEQASAIYTSPYGKYGVEFYLTEYTKNYGAPCGAYYGVSGTAVYARKFANAFVAVNSSTTSAQVVTLPSGHTYTDIEGRAVSNPLTIPANDSFVLMTTSGCN